MTTRASITHDCITDAIGQAEADSARLRNASDELAAALAPFGWAQVFEPRESDGETRVNACFAAAPGESTCAGRNLVFVTVVTCRVGPASLATWFEVELHGEFGRGDTLTEALDDLGFQPVH